jgi:hypothetical protein
MNYQMYTWMDYYSIFLKSGKTSQLDKGNELKNLFTFSAPNYLPNNLLKFGHMNHPIYSYYSLPL